jgi:ABC-type branched-subunit amino acid transport system ATPase component
VVLRWYRRGGASSRASLCAKTSWWRRDAGRDRIGATVRKLKESGLSIVLVEQNPKLVFEIADDIVILNSGQVAVSAPAAELRGENVDLRQHLGVF